MLPRHLQPSPTQSRMRDAADRRRDILLSVLVACLSTIVMFRLQIGNGFTVLFGDNDDAIIGVSILEHWKHFLEGAARWNRVSYFFPYRDSLGYNDGLFLYGVPYAFLRLRGL